MRSSFAAVAIAFALAACPSISAIARDDASKASLVGPVAAAGTDDGMTISGAIEKFPAGTKIWVTIVYEPGGPSKPISGPEDDHVILGSDGKFQAHLRNDSDRPFKPGAYTVMLECHFNSGWQSVDVLRKAGVELDSKGRSDIYTNPNAIPASPDFKPNDPEFPNAGRYLSVMREVSLGSIPANQMAIDGVKAATLLVQGQGRSGLPVGKSVDWYASVGGFRPIAWSAALGHEGNWIVTLDCIDGEKQTKAQWSYDPKSKMVKYLDHLAKTLSYVSPD